MNTASLYILLLICSLTASAQINNWFPVSTGDKALTGSNFLIERIDPLHIRSRSKLGSVLLYSPSKQDSGDRLIIMPENILLIRFSRRGSEYWVAVKVLSKSWQELIASVIQPPMTKPLESPIRNSFNQQEGQAITQLVNLIKSAYGCKISSSQKLSTKYLGINTSALKDQYDKVQYSQKENELARIEHTLTVKRGRSLYGISHITGEFIFEYRFRDLEYVQLIKDGGAIPTQCPTLRECKYLVYGPKIIADLVVAPSHLKLSPAEKSYYHITNPSVDDPNTERPQAEALDTNPLDKVKENVFTCPRGLNLNQTFSFDSLLSGEINTLLISEPNTRNLSDWKLLLKDNCYICNDLPNAILSSKSSITISVQETIDYEKLGLEKNPELQADITENVNQAFRLATQGLINKNNIEFFGEEGFVFQDSRDGLVVYYDNELITLPNYKNQRIDKGALNDWLQLFSRSKTPIKVPEVPDQSIIMEIFQEVARGKKYWSKRYRQNPIAFLAKYCE